jgi:ribose 5-phosphate isomerase B
VKIALASDHAGFDYKQQIADHLRNDGYGVVDFGCHSSESCDYPDFVHPAAAAVAAGECDRGIVFGGSGNGEAITANRHAGIRCALCWNEETARLSRLHNDANMISFGQRRWISRRQSRPSTSGCRLSSKAVAILPEFAALISCLLAACPDTHVALDVVEQLMY